MIFWKIGVHFGPADQDIGQAHLADYFAQRGLSRPGDRRLVVAHFQGGFLGVPYHPEQDCVYIDRNCVFGQGFFGVDRRHHHTVVDPDRGAIDDGHNPEHARTAQAAEFAQPQHDRLLPLLSHFQGE
jgi:hypothetical protein